MRKFNPFWITQSLIHATGAKLLYLPPYSPDLNLIERQFAVLKKYREYHAELPLTEIINVFDSA
jgi:transposase